VQWVYLHPQGGEKCRRNLQGKFASAPPAHQVHPSQAEQKSILGRAKKVVNFFEEKSAPQKKSWLRLSVCLVRVNHERNH